MKEPAFPTIDLDGNATDGITKREYIAVKVLTALMAKDEFNNQHENIRQSLAIADAFLEQTK